MFRKVTIEILFGIWILLLGLIVFVKAYSPIYFEGDDASTIIYHLFGRNEQIQQPYSAYHSGFDWILTFFPSDEVVLRNVSFCLSFWSGVLIIFLLGFWLIRFYSKTYQSAIFFAFLLPFIVPELLFLTLIVNPTNIGFVFCLLGLIALESYLLSKNYGYLVLVPIFFLLGVPFRWSLIIFVLVILGILIYKYSWYPSKKFILLLAITFTTCVSAALMGILITGYSPLKVFDIMLWGAGYYVPGPPSYGVLVANGLSLFTPFFTVTLAIGIIRMILKKQFRLMCLFFLSILPFFFLGLDISLKFTITILPVALLISLIGIEFLFKNKIIQSLIVISILIPWIIGINFFSNGTAYGPGFEINQWNVDSVAFDLKFDNEHLNPDNRISIKNFELSFTGGFAFPTVEGPRPFWGYGSIIFGGQWKRFHQSIRNERVELLKILSVNKHSILLQDSRFNSFQCFLYENGYKCSDQNDDYPSHLERIYSNGSENIKIIVPKNGFSFVKNCNHIKFFWPDAIYTSSTLKASIIESCELYKRWAPFTLIRKQ